MLSLPNPPTSSSAASSAAATGRRASARGKQPAAVAPHASTAAATSILAMAASRRSSSVTVDFDAALKKVSGEKDRRIDELSRELSRLRSRIREDSHQAELGRGTAGDQVTAAEQQLLQIQISSQEDIKEMKHKMAEKDQRVVEMERTEHRYIEAIAELRNRIETLENYMATLPTSEEFEQRGELVEELNREREALCARVEETEAEVAAQTAALADRDRVHDELKADHADIHAQHREKCDSHAEVETKLGVTEQQLTEQLAGMRGQRDDGLKEIADQTTEIIVLKQRAEELCVQLEEEEKRGDRRENTLGELREDVRILQLRDRESTTVIHELQDIKFSAESKLKAQASTITELRTALKALRSANQELLTGNYDLPQYTSPTASEAQIRAPEPLSKRPEDEAIQDELAECLMRLEGVIKVVVARARGQEPDISMLLGIEKPADHRFVRTNDREQQLGNLRNMKREIEDVRSWLCNRYAQDVGPEACAMQ